MEKIIETKICKFCFAEFDITDKDLEFYNKVSPVFNNTKYNIPTLEICSDCLFRQQFSFRNERNLYRRKCDLTGKNIISNYSPDKQYKVYEQNEWWSDKWNALSYGREYDFSRNFFDQFDQLFINVPKLNLANVNCENSEYNNGIVNSKNAYLSFYGTKMIDSNYCSASFDIVGSNDVWWSAFIENSYEIISSDNLFNSSFCYYSSYGKNILFCFECYGCSDCIMCYGLKNKKYCIKNVQYLEIDYKKYLTDFISGSYKKLEEAKIEFNEFLIKQPHKFLHIMNCEDCSGDYLFSSKNCIDCYTIIGGEDGKNIFEGGRFLGAYNSSLIYDSKYIVNSSVLSGDSYNIFFSLEVSKSQNIFYCNSMDGCSDCFGSTGLTNQKYCILNKQYTKEEYEILVPKIIEHMIMTKEWGEFFPSSISPFGYNETVAMEYYPMDPVGNGLKPFPTDRFKWSTYENPIPLVSKTIPASKLPDNIKDIPDDILNWAILPDDDVGNAGMRSDQAGSIQKPFRIIKPELEFYRKHNLPIPRRHPDQRHLDRMKLRNPRKLYDRLCDKCHIDIKTTYSPDREEIVYCEECYLKEVI